MTNPEERGQQWRYIGAIAILVAVGIFGLLVGYGFSDHANDQQNKKLRAAVRDQTDEVLTNRARINQLERGYATRGIPIPPTTTTTPARRTAPPRRTTSSTTTTTQPPSTTSTTAEPPKSCTVKVDGVCIGGN